MKDWKAECEQLRRENKNLREANAVLEYRARAAESRLKDYTEGFKFEFKQTLLDLLR